MPDFPIVLPEVDLLPIQIPTPFNSNPFFCVNLDWLRIHLSTNLVRGSHPEFETIWVESLWCWPSNEQFYLLHIFLQENIKSMKEHRILTGKIDCFMLFSLKPTEWILYGSKNDFDFEPAKAYRWPNLDQFGMSVDTPVYPLLQYP